MHNNIDVSEHMPQKMSAPCCIPFKYLRLDTQKLILLKVLVTWQVSSGTLTWHKNDFSIQKLDWLILKAIKYTSSQVEQLEYSALVSSSTWLTTVIQILNP